MKISVNDLTKDELIKELLKQQELIKHLSQKTESLTKEKLEYKEFFDNSPAPMWKEDITELKEKEKLLKESEEKFSKLFQTSPNVLIISKLDDGKIIEINDIGIKVIGKPKNELLNKTSIELGLVDAEIRARLLKYLQDQGYYSEVEIAVPLPNGEQRVGLFYGQIITLGSQQCIFQTIVDISARKKAELAVQKSEIAFRKVLESLELLAISLDNKGNIIFCNEYVLKLTGWKREEVLGKNWFNIFIHEDIIDAVKYSVFNKAIETGELSTHHQNNIITRTGDQRIINWNNTFRYDSLGNVINLTSIGEDITERYKVEEKNRFLARMLQSSPLAYIVTDLQGNITDVNPALEEMMGYSKEELLGKNPGIFNSEENADQIQENIFETIKNNGVWTGELLNKKRNGETFYIYSSIFPFHDDKGKINSFIGFLQDVTERKQIEIALIKSNMRISNVQSQLLEAEQIAKIGSWEWDIVSGNISWSDQLYRILGYKPGEVSASFELSKSHQHPDDLEAYIQHVEQVFEIPSKSSKEQIFELKTDFTYENRIVCVDKSQKWIRTHGKIIRDENNNLIRMLGSLQDITERKTVEQDLMESEEKFSKAFYNHPIAMQIINLSDNRRLEWNKSMVDLYGYTNEELKEENISNLRMAVDPEATREGIKQLLKDRFVKNKSMKIRTKSGKIKNIISSAAMLDISDSNLAIVSSIDVTEKKKIENSLIESEKKFKQLFNNMGNGIAIFEPVDDGENFILIDINKSCEKITNVKREKVKGRKVTEAFPVIKEIGLFNVFKEVNSTSKPKQNPLALYKNGRSETWLENYVYKLPSGQIVAIFEDTSAVKKAIDALKESEEKFHKIFRTSPDSIILTRMEDGEIIDANDVTSEITGYRSGEFIGKKTTEINLWKSVEDRNNYVKKLVTERSVKGLEMEFIKKSGIIRTGLLSGAMIQINQKDYIIGILRDITDKSIFEKKLKDTNEELRNLSQYLNNVREEERKNIAREVHDDLGQKLTALNLDISWIKQSIPDSLDDLKQQFDPVLEMINQSIITVQRISTELRPGILDDLGLINAIQWQSNEISRRSNLIFNLNLYKEEVALHDEIKTALFRVYQEALTNIVRHSDAKNVFVNLGIDKRNIIFEIADDGKGISEANKSGSTSFGIMGMRERIASIDGNIEITNQANSGTKIKIIAPFPEDI